MKKRVFIKTKNLTKQFGDVVAVDHVDMEISLGEIRGLIGENGSGKSTISSMISGIHDISSGEILLDGKPYAPKDPGDARNHGISMIVQEMGTIDNLTVAENIFLGDEKRFARRGIINATAMIEEAKKALEAIGVADIDPAKPTSAYSFEQRKLIEIAKAVYYDPLLFIVDETTTALSHDGRENIYEIIHSLKAKGKAVLFISHDLPELIRNCDVLTVLRDGKLVDTIPRADFDESKIKQSMVGRVIEGDYYRSDYDSATGEKTVLEVKNAVSVLLKDISLSLHEGEILGLGGLSGCGMHELGQVLFGMENLISGEVLVTDTQTGKTTYVTDIPSALKHKIGYISKNRDKEMLILPASIKENLTISALNLFGKVILPKAEREFAQKQIDHLSIRCSSMNQPVSELSGGNKQKVSFGKVLGNGSKILIMDSPTRGVDVGVKTTMYQLIYKLKQKGYSILIISEELPELIGMCDSIIVLKNGRMAKRFQRSRDLSEAQIIEYMI